MRLLERYILEIISLSGGNSVSSIETNEPTGESLDSKIREIAYKFVYRGFERNPCFITIQSNENKVIVEMKVDKSIESNVIGFVYFRKIKNSSGGSNVTGKKITGKKIKGKVVWGCRGAECLAKGYGPLLYEIAMEYINWKYKGAIMADERHHNEWKLESVSDDAYKIWKKYLERSSKKEITAYQLDISNDEKEDYKKHFGIDINQITDKDPSDDIDSISLEFIKSKGESDIQGTKWSKSPLTKAFSKQDSRLTSYLLAMSNFLNYEFIKEI
jgi:hypothetical protein